MSRTVFSSDPVWYTIAHRKKSNTRGWVYRCGYRSQNLDEIRELAQREGESGEYSLIRIVDSNTNEIIQTVMRGGKFQ